jgi:3-hydroxymyristoyl/3-hydroxydecanoyl-(acyl carrier protein) dehydratase
MPTVLPEIIAQTQLSETQWQLELAIQPDLFWFLGHFPDAPILPGVVQLSWARQQAMRLWPTALAWLARAGSMESIKFQQVVRPGDRVLLTLSLEPERHRLAFSYASAEPQSTIKYASGRLVAAP